MFKSIVTMIVFCLVSLSFAQPELEWENHYGNELIGEVCYTVLQTYDNGFVLSGYVSNQRHEPRIEVDYFLVKTDADGEEIWTGNYGGEDRDRGKRAISTPDSGFIMGGYSLSWDDGRYRGLVVKTDRDGDEEWSEYFGEELTRIRPIALHPDGGYLLGGTTGDSWNYGLVYLDEDGETVWSREYGGRGADDCLGLCATSDGGFALAGVTTSFGEGGYDFYLVKTDENGEEEWSQTYGGEEIDYCFNLIQTSDDGFCLVGTTESFGAGRYDVYVVRTDEDGEEIWSRSYGGQRDEEGRDIIELEDGGFVVGGYAESFTRTNSEDFYMLRIDSEGDSIWQVITGDLDYPEEANSLLRTIDGGFALAGVTRAISGGNDFWLVKYGPEPLSWIPVQDTRFVEDSHLVYNVEYLLENIMPYIYRDSLLVFTVVDHDYIRGEFEDDTLTIFTEPDFFGEDSVGIIVAEEREEGGCDTTYLHLIIHPLNDLPGNFALLSPPDEAVIGSWVATFTWEQAVQNEWEEDLVRYNLHFRAGENENGFWERLDTTYKDLSMVQLANRLGIELGQSDIEIEWWVNALDDSGLTECDEHFTFTIPVEHVPPGEAGAIPDEFGLGPIYPNPFNSRTNIRYQLPLPVNVVLTIYDVSGREVVKLIDKKMDVGYHNIEWSASDMPAGIYLCRMEAGFFFHIRKIILIR